MLEIIVVDDLSSDNSAEVVKSYTKKHKNVRLIVNSRNSGGAAEPTNIGVMAASYDYVAVVDADSEPEPDALNKMIGFLQEDERVGGVTCAVVAKTPVTFMQKLQSIEYAIIGWARKILDLVDAVYVTPGPFALYKKKVLIEIGLFDTTNMTQDIEIVWRMMAHGYLARMSLGARVHSETPTKISHWWQQRIRWNIGGTQCIWKYKTHLFKRGMLGLFIIPFFSFSLFIGLFGLGLFMYLATNRVWGWYLSTKYSVYGGGATVIRLQELTFLPSVLNFFGAALFLLGLFYTIFGLGVMKAWKGPHKNPFNIAFYMLIYLTIYPLIMVTALYKLATKRYSW